LKFKIDENLPVEAAVLLRKAGFEGDMVAEEHLSGADDSTVAGAVRSGVRVPVTLHRDFGDIRDCGSQSPTASVFAQVRASYFEATRIAHSTTATNGSKTKQECETAKLRQGRNIAFGNRPGSQRATLFLRP
jgi:predicted nuclease of predicted toxin-antitoxin system